MKEITLSHVEETNAETTFTSISKRSKTHFIIIRVKTMSNANVTNKAGDGTNDAIKTFKMLVATRNNEIPVKNSTKIDFDEQLPIEVKNSKKFKFDITACCN